MNPQGNLRSVGKATPSTPASGATDGVFLGIKYIDFIILCKFSSHSYVES